MYFPTFAQTVVVLAAAAPAVLAAPSNSDAAFKDAVLKTHNNARAKHGVPGLQWDQTLANFAQQWANVDCQFKHSGGKYGENLAGKWTTAKPDFIAETRSGINSWYDEIKKYDFNKPGFSMGTGHFTQVVWKNTKKVGCAWNTKSCPGNGQANKMPFYKMVCEYDPPGNYAGQFPQNVPRPIRQAQFNVAGQEIVAVDEWIVAEHVMEDDDEGVYAEIEGVEGEEGDAPEL